MWLTNTSIRRPIFIIMFVLALVVMGLISRNKMPKELNPNVDIPYITIITTYGGAGPSEIETLVSEPIEKGVTSIGNLKNITSTSQTGISTVGLEFEMGTDLEAAAADVRDKVSIVKASLPKDANEPKVMKVDISSEPVMTIGLAGTLSPKEMRILADDVVSDRLAKVGGVASVNVSGGEEREIAVSVDKNRLDAYGLAISSVVDAINSANDNIPAGSIKEGARDYTIRTVGEFVDAKEIQECPITLSDKSVIKVGDIAKVRDTVVEPTTIVRLNGKSSVVFSIQKQSGANTVAIADGIKRELKLLQPMLPAGVKPIIANDQSVQVKTALEAVNSSLLEGILLVVLIVFLFLHTVRATFIVGLAIPTSLLATYLPTGAMGFTQNTMFLMALSLVVGILVDDSIVVLENIERHLRLREEPAEAALNGRSEIGLAAITITMVDIVVFLPIAFMGGIIGQFFRQFGVTIAVATAFSLLMSFTLTPMLSSIWMKSEQDKERDEELIRLRHKSGRASLKDKLDLSVGHIFDGLERQLAALDRGYKRVLEWALHNRFLTITIGIVALLVVMLMLMPLPPLNAMGSPKMVMALAPRLIVAFICLLLLSISFVINPAGRKVATWIAATVVVVAATIYFPFGFEFFPTSDQAQFSITIRNPPGTSLLQTDKVVSQVAKIVMAVPEMKPVYYRVSDAIWYNPATWSSGHNESNTGYCMATTGSSSQGMSGSGNSGGQYGYVFAKVVDKNRRTRSVQEIVDDVQQKTAHIAGAEMISVSISSGGGPSAGITKEVQGQDMASIIAEANRVAGVMRKTPGTMNVDISYKPSTPERRIVVDKYRAAKLGMTLTQIAVAARTAIDGDNNVKLRESGTEYPIRVQYEMSDRNKTSDVNSLIIATKNGAPIYLNDVAQIVYDLSPNKIERKNRQRVISVSSGIASGYQMGNLTTAIDEGLSKITVIPGTSIGAGGSSKMMQESIAAMAAALALAILLMYMLMGALFESFLTPFVIMFSLPLALVGALLALLLTGKPLGMTAMIGIIMLMGLVTKNAILLIDYTNTMMARGLNRHEALLEAGPTRLRPILMTTLAMIGGMLPTALALTQGSETRSPMAITVIGGLIISTMLTLIVIPVVFTIVDDMWMAFRHRFFPHTRSRKQTTAATESDTDQ